MAVGQTKVISITGAGNQDTGFSILQSVNLDLSAAGVIRIREGASNGNIVGQGTFAGQGNWSPALGAEGIRCRATGTGTFFIENSAGNVAGGVAGNP